MVVPSRRNGMVEDDENEEEGLFEEEALVELDSDTPPHLRPLAEAAQVGDVNALRHALDNLIGSIDEPGSIYLVSSYCQKEELTWKLRMRMELFLFMMPVLGQFRMCEAMLDAVDVEGDTPLHHAARGEHVAVIQLLLASGPTPTKANIYGKIPSELSDPESQARMIIETAANAVTCR